MKTPPEQFEQQQSQYRRQMAEVMARIRKYRGTHEEFEEIMGIMIKLEKWMVEVFGEDKSQRKLPLQHESDVVTMMYGKEKDRTISDLLTLMRGRYIRFLERAHANTGIYTIETDEVILPPGDTPGPVPNGKGGGLEEARFGKRLEEIMGLLHSIGIFADDVVIIRGKVTSEMMRRESYTIVEIPKIRKQILICNQIGEATYIIQQSLPRRELMLLNKEALLEKHGPKIDRIIYANRSQWERDVLEAVQRNVNIAQIQRLNMPIMERIRMRITAEITAEIWAGMKGKEKAKFKIEGRGLMAIARIFGVKGNPVNNHNDHLALGRAIYGEQECLKEEPVVELTKERVKRYLEKKGITAEKWAGMKQKEKLKFKIEGRGLMAIAGIFGVKGHPVSNHNDHLALGRAIYGEQECLKEESVVELTKEQLKRYLEKEGLTAEIWAEMKQKEKAKFKIEGRGLFAIARIFGVKGDPVSNHNNHLALGRVIYGEQECLKEESVVELTKEQVKRYLEKEGLTAEIWAGMKGKEKRKFKIEGRGLFAIAGIFGVKGHPVGNHNDHLALGRAIYGEQECLKEEAVVELTKEQVKRYLEKEGITAEKWAGMNRKEKEKFKIEGRGLKAIARIFGVKGDPAGIHNDHLALGRVIYREQECLKEESVVELTKEQVKRYLEKEGLTAEIWAGMQKKEKRKFKIESRGLTTIARIFGVKGNPAGNHNDHLALGRAIYGEQECLMELELTKEQVKRYLEKEGITAEKWAGMNRKEKEKFKIEGRGLFAIAGIFGVKGKPVNNHNDHLALGRAIYGNLPYLRKKKQSGSI
jgi:uncharacterized protein (DUF1778 family)